MSANELFELACRRELYGRQMRVAADNATSVETYAALLVAARDAQREANLWLARAIELEELDC